MIMSIIAAAFVTIGRRLYNLCNINKTDFNPSDGKLRIYFSDGDQAELSNPDDIDQFHRAIDKFTVDPPELEQPSKPDKPAADQEPATDDDGDGEFAETGEGEGDGDGEPSETDDEPSELELAGVPEDLAAMLHAGGIDTVEAALTHPDLSQIDQIGTGRRDKILKILNS